MTKQSERINRIRSQIQQLILLRETGPKSAAWHAARAKLIWRLHDEIKTQEQLEREQDGRGKEANE